MRLWHKDLIDALPDKQLKGQWRECCAIAKRIKEKETPNHILVNRIMDYPPEDFIIYAYMVYAEMFHRGYICYFETFLRYYSASELRGIDYTDTSQSTINRIFYNWHNEDYMDECYYNLREKYHCGGISDDEWARIKWRYCEYKAEHRNKGNQ